MSGDQLFLDPVEEPSRRDLEAWHTRRDQVPRAGQVGELKRPDAALWAKHLGLNTDYDLPVETDDFQRLPRHDDKKVQTLHYFDELDARLRKVRAAARTAIEESGANMLYLAFGFLEWRDQAASRAHQAPLLLLPVELEREQTRGGRYRTKMRWTGEEVQPNLSLQKKLEEFNIKLPERQEDEALEGHLTDVLRAVRHRTDWFVRRYVTLGLFEFGKILLYLDLDPARWPSTAPIDGHPLVKAALEGEEVSGEKTSGGSTLDSSSEAAELRDLKLELVDRADSSQCEALQMALSGRNLVVEGPPGTGKSQTITNLVAAALARGKSVLFVAEKLAALEVVRRRMRELGLGDFCLELHSHKTRKTDVLDDVGVRMKASAFVRPPKNLESALARLVERRRKLSSYVETISRTAGAFADLTIWDSLMRAGRARRKLGSMVKALENAGLKIEEAGLLSWAQFSDAKARLRQFMDAYRELAVEGSAYEHPWAGVSAARVLPHDSHQICRLAAKWADAAESYERTLQRTGIPEAPATELAAVGGALSTLAELRPSAQHGERAVVFIEQALSVSIGRTAEGATHSLQVARLAAAAPLDKLQFRNSRILSSGASKWLRMHRDRVDALRQRREELRQIFKEGAFAKSTDDLEEWSATLGQRGIFVWFSKRWRAASAAWAGCVRPASLRIRTRERAVKLSSLRAFVADVATLRADGSVEEYLGQSARDAAFDLEGAIAVADWADQLREVLPDFLSKPLVQSDRDWLEQLGSLMDKENGSALKRLSASKIDSPETTFWRCLASTFLPNVLQQRAAECSSDESWQSLVSDLENCRQLAQQLLDCERGFVSATDLDRPVWLRSTGPTLTEVASRARFASANAALLARWLDFDRVRRASTEVIEHELVHAATAGGVEASKLDVCFDFLVFDALARGAFADSPMLHTASGKALDTWRDEYRSLDAQVMELRRVQIATKLLQRSPPEGRQSGLKSEITEMALLRAEMNKQRRHIPIRQLLLRAGKALQTLKPCFMMGPLSVAQYIAPGSLKFDLVIMDEASQMRPEDAIGALARSGQAVVVGDPKQLPPTSFFDRISERAGEDDDDETTLAEDSKSILELSSSIFDHRMLRWHYRSRHEALIAFSNREFYKGELIVFPSPTGQAERFGIGWNFISDGVTTKGVNPIEARAIARAAANFIIQQPNRSLGVVAMNIKQSQRIMDELSALADSDPALGVALAKAEKEEASEPFFVKNLENVQGDERDVVMISMTYGPAMTGGPTPQNFGPINQETGWRRLNVLFTRAKERMEIFSSMRSSDVAPREGGDRGPRALKLFLDYAEKGTLGVLPVNGGRDTDSDFEDAVLEGLRELNFECVPQVGVANFFLDIGVRNPSSPAEFIAGIECDGAAYHSEKSARDRDRLRQEILEGLGWNIIRVWSTDWFRDPSGELDRIAGELKRLISAWVEKHSSQAMTLGKGSERETQAEEQQLGQGRLFDVPLMAESVLSSDARSARISVEQARAKLIDLRERIIKVQFPDTNPANGLLRKSMLDALLLKRPTDMDEFRRSIRLDLRENTDAKELKEFGEQVFDILAEIGA
jgi:very-short-patch-repair endonuclease